MSHTLEQGHERLRPHGHLHSPCQLLTQTHPGPRTHTSPGTPFSCQSSPRPILPASPFQTTVCPAGSSESQKGQAWDPLIPYTHDSDTIPFPESPLQGSVTRYSLCAMMSELGMGTIFGSHVPVPADPLSTFFIPWGHFAPPESMFGDLSMFPEPPACKCHPLPCMSTCPVVGSAAEPDLWGATGMGSGCVLSQCSGRDGAFAVLTVLFEALGSTRAGSAV